MRWVEDRLGVAPVFGGVHDGFGTRNALLGLGYPYLEVLSLDPEQGDVSIPWNERVRAMASPALLTVADLEDPVEGSGPDVPVARGWGCSRVGRCVYEDTSVLAVGAVHA
jgi:hypothetical protein